MVFVDFIFEAERIVFFGLWMDGRTGLCDSDVISGTGFLFFFCNGCRASTKVR